MTKEKIMVMAGIARGKPKIQPRKWVRLTNVGIFEIIKQIDRDAATMPKELRQFARAVEAKLKKENA